METKQDAMVEEIFAALKNNQLELPALPDLAIKIRDKLDDPNVSAEQLLNLLSTDPSITVQIIKAANSAAFSSGAPVDTLRGAISRIGYRMLRNLVMTITMGKLFNAANPVINRRIKTLWEHSREVAAISYVIARQQRHLNPEQAMLAGLVHDIGVLPVCLYADRHFSQLNEDALQGMIRKFAAMIGTGVLQSWHFPEELVGVVAGHENLQRTNESGLADYADVVTVANLQIPGSAKFVNWENVSAAGRLGYSPAACQNFLTTYAEQLGAVQNMLGLNNALKPQLLTPIADTGKAPPRQYPIPPKQDKPKAGVLSALTRLFL